MNAGLTIAAIAALLGGLAAQTAPPPRASLHAAWLHELLDLDSQGAAASYEVLATEQGGPAGQRWLAAARLCELRRLGAAPSTRGTDLAGMPESLQKALRETQQSPVPTDLLDRARNHPEGLLEWLRQNQHAPRFSARPAVAEAHRQALNQSEPGKREMRRQLLAKMQVATQRGDRRTATELWRQIRLLEPESREARPFDHVRALFILKCELAGKATQAAHLRAQYFGDWQPPGGPAPTVEATLLNIAAMLRADDLLADEDDQLRLLQERLQAGGDGAAKVLQLLARVPVYAEQLLRRD
jgi:hypothetical protein